MERVRHRTAMRGRGGHGGWVAVQGLIAVAVGVLAFPEVTVRALALLLGIGLSLLGLAGILVRGRAPSYARWRGTVFPGGERGRRAAVPSATVRAGAVVLRRRGQRPGPRGARRALDVGLAVHLTQQEKRSL